MARLAAGACRGAVRVILSHMAKQDLSLVFQALADPTRRAMLERLGQGEVAVSALARPTGMALPTILRHLAVLEAAGLISSAKAGRVRSCAVVPGALDATRSWLAAQRALWDARTDRLEAYLETLMKEKHDDA